MEPPAPQKIDRQFWLGLGIIVVAAALMFYSNLSYPLFEPDEGRHAEIGREMLLSGDWIMPTLHWEPYFNKPVLFYWLIAISLSVFGNHGWAVRLVPATSAFVTVLATYFFGCRFVTRRAGLLAALSMILSIGFVLCGRFVIVDSILTLLVTMTLFMAYAAVQSRQLRWHWWIVSALLAGLGILAKGPIALVLTVPVLWAYTWLTPDRTRLRLRHWLIYGIVSLAICLPWYIAVAMRQPGFLEQFFLDHHLERFWSGQDHHKQPFWFYIPVLLAGFLPWPLVLLACLWFLFSRSPRVAVLRTRPLGFCLLWTAWSMFFFSMSKGKLPTYILPIMPAVALLMGSYLEPVLFCAPTAPCFRLARKFMPALLVLIASPVWIVLSFVCWSLGVIPMTGLGISVVFACSIALALVLLWGRIMTPLQIWALGAVLTWVLLAEISTFLVPFKAHLRMPVASAHPVRNLVKKGQMGIVFVGDKYHSLAFQLNNDKALCYQQRKTPQQVREFLQHHPRNMLHVGINFDVSYLEKLLPPGHTARIFCRNQGFNSYLLEISTAQSRQLLPTKANAIPAIRKAPPLHSN